MTRHDAVRGRGVGAWVASLLGWVEWPRPAGFPSRDEADDPILELGSAGRIAADRVEIDWDDDLLRALMA